MSWTKWTPWILEANPEEIESESGHREDCKKEATAETIRSLKDRYGDRHVAVGLRQQSKKWNQAYVESHQKLAAGRGWLSRHAIPASCKGHGYKGLTVQKRRQKCPECKSGIKDQGIRWRLRLRKERTSVRIFRKTI
jgi:predicted Zn-ribbon and HTH transcriptional regulator